MTDPLDARADALADDADGADDELAAAQAAVTAELAGSEPLTMPTDVLARLRTAMADEQTAREHVPVLTKAEPARPNTSVLPGGGTVVPLDAARRRRIRLLASVAAAVVVLGGGGLSLALALHGSGSSDQATVSSAAAAPSTAYTIDQTGRSFSDPAELAAALGASVPATTTAQSGADTATDGGAPSAASPSVPAPVAAGTLSNETFTTTSGGMTPVVVPDLLGCLRRITAQDPPVVLSLEGIVYAGKPALLMTLPGGAASDDVFVVDETCSATHDGILTFVSVPK